MFQRKLQTDGHGHLIISASRMMCFFLAFGASKAQFNICPPGLAGSKSIDAFGYLNNSASVQLGLSHRIPCPSFESTEEPCMVVWYKESSVGEQIELVRHNDSGEFRQRERYAISRHYKLVIKDIVSSDDGRYFCQVTPRESSLARTEEINIYVIGNTFAKRERSVSSTMDLLRGQRQALPCHCTTAALYKPISTVYWTTGEGITSDTNIIAARFSHIILQFQHEFGATITYNSSLVINSLTGLSGITRFWCHVFLSNGTLNSCSVDINIKDEYETDFALRASQTHFYLQNGKRQILPCTSWTHNTPLCQVQWLKYSSGQQRHILTYKVSSDDVLHDHGFDITGDFGLVINSANNASGGNYSCSTDSGTEFEIISSEVIDDKFPLDGGKVLESSKIYFEVGKCYVLPCQAASNTTDTKRGAILKWSFDTRTEQTTTVIDSLTLPHGSKTLSHVGENASQAISPNGSLLLSFCQDSYMYGRYWCYFFPKHGTLVRSYVDVVMDVSTEAMETQNSISLIGGSFASLLLCLLVFLAKGKTGRAGEQSGSGARHKTKLSDATQRTADKCEEALKRIYKATGSYVQMIPWVDDDQKHIMDIYIKLQLEKDHECDLKGDVGSYSDVFKLRSKEGHAINRAIFKGDPGHGKTTLFNKIAYDWATGTTAVLKRFKFVFLLKMRSLKQESDLIEALFDQLLDSTEISKSDLQSFIKAHANEVLFLVDGFDEFTSTELDEARFGSLLKVLNRKGRYKDCWAFVTTRTSGFDKLTKQYLIQKPFAHLNVLGFSREDIEAYVNKYYTEEPYKASGLLARMESTNVLFDLAKSPMLLLLMCSLWRVNSNLPDTMSRFYDEALKFIFKRKTKNMPGRQLSSVIIAIGKVALDGLLSLNQKLLFKEEDFEPHVLEKAIQAGILTSERVQKEKSLGICKNVYFIHKTFQEFCAAKYYQCMNAKDAAKYFETFFSQISDPLGFEYLLRFCCGNANRTKTLSILRILVTKVEQWHKGSLCDKRLCLVLNCFFESECENKLQLDELIRCVLSHSLQLPDVTIDVMTSFMYFLDRVTDQTSGRDKSYLCRVGYLDISGSQFKHFPERFARYVKEMRCLRALNFNPNSLTASQFGTCLENKMLLTKVCVTGRQNEEGRDFVSDLCSHLSKPKHLQQVHFRNCSLKGDDIQHIAGAMSNMQEIDALDLSGNEALGGSGTAWSYLAKIKQIQNVNLQNCNLTADDIPHIANALSNMPRLSELDLSGNQALGGSGTAWSYLAKIKKIQNVNLQDCNLTADDIPHIAHALSNMPKLSALGLSQNKTLGGSGSAWCDLAKIKHIKNVDLMNCALTGLDLPHIVNALSRMPKVAELDLSFNETVAGSGSAWHHLKNIKHVQKVIFMNCKLTNADIPYIIGALMHITKDIELDLSFNDTLSGSGQAWSELAKIEHIKKVTLMNCKLTGHDLPHIAEALSNMTHVIELDLSFNETLAGLGCAWSHLANINHIQRLTLRYCNLLRDDLQNIADALSNSMKLAELDLSENETLGGSGSAWSHLAKIKDIQKVSIKNCNLTGSDVLHIADALGDRMKLAELDLSGNKTLAGSGSAWHYLKKVEHIQKVTLKNCNLTGNDIPHIVDALSSIPDLVELDLSGNDNLGGSGRAWSHLTKIKQIQRLIFRYCGLTGGDIEYLARALANMPNLVELDLSFNETLSGSGNSWLSLAKVKKLKVLSVQECFLTDNDREHIAEVKSQKSTLMEVKY